MKELKLAFDAYASTLGGKLYGLHIYSYNETHKEREVQMIADSLTISTSTRGESVTHGLHASQLHVSLYSDSDRCYEWLASSNDREVYCELYTEGHLVWRGMLDGEQWHEPYSYKDGYATDLVFSDFGVLGRTRLSDACGERTVYTIKGFVQKCLDAIYPGNPGKLKVETSTKTRNLLASLSDMVAIDPSQLEQYTEAGALASICRDMVSYVPSELKSVHTGNICDTIIDLSHWHNDKDRPEDESDVQSVLEDILKALNLHLWQTTRGDYVLADHETLAGHYVYATLDAMGSDATIETTETYNRLTLTVDPDTDTSLGKPDMDSVEGRDIHLIDLNDKVNDVTACTFTYSARLNKPISLTGGTDRSNYAYRTKSGSVSTSDKGVAVYVKPFTLLHFEEYKGQNVDAFDDWNDVKDFYPADLKEYPAVWTEEFQLPQVDLSTSSEYFIALSLELLLDNSYNPYQRDVDMSTQRATFKHFALDKKKYDKLRKHFRCVQNLFLTAEVTCGDYKLVNSTFEGGFMRLQIADPSDPFRFQTRWVAKSNTNARLLIPYADVKLGKWCKPVRNYTLSGINPMFEIKSEARASHNDTLTFPIPPVTNAPIRVSTSGRFFHIDCNIIVANGDNGSLLVGFPQSYVRTPDLTKGKIYESDNTFVGRMSNLISYYLMRNMKLELVRRDEREEKGEELVLASTLNDKAFEHRKEELALSSEPALPSISKSLLRTLEERERKSFLAKLVEYVTKEKLSPIVTLPPVRGKLTCGAFTGTLEELYIAEQYTHYATRRNRISGTYAPINSITVLHEGKHFLVTQSDWNVLSDTTQLTMEEIKAVDYSAKYIERTK